uniref:Leucokinin n=1 Tax=Grapholita molesta TaxID=192188 RepID=A0A7D7KGF2_GRAMO|nr:leucokinin [Grapholita molesta]
MSDHNIPGCQLIHPVVNSTHVMSGRRANRNMLHYWLLLSWFGTASLQYIDVGPTPDAALAPIISKFDAQEPFVNYFTLPPQGEFNLQSIPVENADVYNRFYPSGEYPPTDRKRRTIDDPKNWLPNVLEGDKQPEVDERTVTPQINQDSASGNETKSEIFSLRKRSFSPWGGKRAEGVKVDQMWTWKRATRSREPSMPKRVRFSPWGGKRSGQVVYKPGNKINRVIFSTSIPALTRILSNYSPAGQLSDATNYQFRPKIDKRHAIKILAMGAQSDQVREALPFKNYLFSLPPLFKPGHPYVDLSLKNDGKRKVIFSQWGGKRMAPIIGPIWTPAPGTVKEATLNAILFIRNNNIDETNDATKAL